MGKELIATNPEKSKLQEEKVLENLKLDKKIKDVLSIHDYTSLNNDLEVMKMLIEHDSDKIQLQQQKLFENLNDLYSSGKLTWEHFEDIKKQIYKTLSFKKKQKTLSDDKIKSEAFILDKKLESVLSDDDYASISNDIEILKIHIKNNSDDSIQLQDKLMNKLQNLKNSGKLTGPMYYSIKKSLEKTILLSKDRNKSVGDTVTIEQ